LPGYEVAVTAGDIERLRELGEGDQFGRGEETLLGAVDDHGFAAVFGDAQHGFDLEDVGERVGFGAVDRPVDLDLCAVPLGGVVEAAVVGEPGVARVREFEHVDAVGDKVGSDVLEVGDDVLGLEQAVECVVHRDRRIDRLVEREGPHVRRDPPDTGQALGLRLVFGESDHFGIEVERDGRDAAAREAARVVAGAAGDFEQGTERTAGDTAELIDDEVHFTRHVAGKRDVVVVSPPVDFAVLGHPQRSTVTSIADRMTRHGKKSTANATGARASCG